MSDPYLPKAHPEFPLCLWKIPSSQSYSTPEIFVIKMCIGEVMGDWLLTDIPIANSQSNMGFCDVHKEPLCCLAPS
jgi:hypothetical protein